MERQWRTRTVEWIEGWLQMFRPGAITSILILLLVFCGSPSVKGDEHAEVVIPAVIIPGRYIPAKKIPEQVIPAIDTPVGRIPSVVIPAIEIPAIYVPPINTTRQRIPIPDYSRITRQEIERYSSTPSPNRTSGVPPTSSRLSDVDRRLQFMSYAGYATFPMVSLFASADLDESGTLSWRELHWFQARLTDRFKYMTNDEALRPDDFMRLGGGDCEDWAIFTAAFCRYWGWDAFVAAFFDDQTGHAITLVRSPDPPPTEYFYWDIDGKTTVKGDRLPPGVYVPVDYEYVGGFSTALRAGMRLTYLMTPERMYGMPL